MNKAYVDNQGEMKLALVGGHLRAFAETFAANLRDGEVAL